MSTEAHALLDTSPLIAHLRKKIDLYEVLDPELVLFTSLITIGELEKGVHRVDDPSRERKKMDALMPPLAILKPDESTAEQYGRIATELELKGTPIPENDLWIAAVAIEYGLPLITGDEHFQRIPELEVQLITW